MTDFPTACFRLGPAATSLIEPAQLTCGHGDLICVRKIQQPNLMLAGDGHLQIVVDSGVTLGLDPQTGGHSILSIPKTDDAQ